MAYANAEYSEEVLISNHTELRWRRRERELDIWSQRQKPRRRCKQLAAMGGVEVDQELLAALTLLSKLGMVTEFSCAGVSVLDEPEDHSLYAYVTIAASEQAEQFVQWAMRHMRHRLLVTYEPARERYDLSSFCIGHNRSFCLLLERCAESFAARAKPL